MNVNIDTENIRVVAPYQNEPNDIQVEASKMENGKLRLMVDHEFTIVPIEWYGVHNWYETVSNSILNDLVKIQMNKNMNENDIRTEIASLIQRFYGKIDTTTHIPERTEF